MRLRVIYKVSRAFGSGSSRVCEFPGECSIAMPSSEVIRTASGAHSGTPSGNRSHSPLESGITVVLCSCVG